MESSITETPPSVTGSNRSAPPLDNFFLALGGLLLFCGLAGCNSGSGGGADSVKSANGEPVAVADVVTTDQNAPTTIPILANDQLPDGLNYDVSIASEPLYGTAQLEADNTISYLPDLDFAGRDKFSYIVKDSRGRSASGKVTINIYCPDCPDIDVTLTWDGNPDAKGYLVHYGDSADSTTQEVGDVPLALISLNLGKELGVRSGETVCFSITAYSNTAESPPSAPNCGAV